MQYGKSVVEYTEHTTRAVFSLYERSNKRGLNIIDWKKKWEQTKRKYTQEKKMKKEN